MRRESNQARAISHHSTNPVSESHTNVSSPTLLQPPITLADNTTLFIFPPSSGCETITWLLERYGISAAMNRQTVPFFLVAIRWAGGETYPYFRVGDQGWSTSLKISMELENLVPAERSLLPRESKLRQEAITLWTQFLNPKLGQAVPKWVYYWLLPHKELLFKPLTKGVPWWQKPLTFVFYPILANLIRKNLELGTEVPNAEEQTIREVFDHVDKQLSDGRPYLMGDKLSLVDIGFAGMAAPVVLEETYGHGGLLPSLDQAPAEMQPLVSELRQRPAGQFINRIYQNFR